MRVFIIALLIAVVSSCTQNIAVNNSKIVPSTNELVHVDSYKKMLEINGGTYMGFIGKDSGRVVEVKTFLMDESPITVGEYLEFLKKNPQWTKSKASKLYVDDTYLHNWPGDFETPEDIDINSPVTNISWFAAKAYAESVGKRLPTIDEWEFVALADEVSKNASDKPEFTDFILKSYEKKGMYKEAVKQSNPNYYGVYDLYGKVWEWTEDFNSVMITGESRSDQNENETLFCAGAAVTTSDLKNYAAFVRYAMRGGLEAKYTVNNVGFRCVKDI